MATITAYEAKTHLPRLLRRVEQGETVIITRHGKPVARLGPIGDGNDSRFRTTIEQMEAIRRRAATYSLDEVLETIHEGHRY